MCTECGVLIVIWFFTKTVSLREGKRTEQFPVRGFRDIFRLTGLWGCRELSMARILLTIFPDRVADGGTDGVLDHRPSPNRCFRRYSLDQGGEPAGKTGDIESVLFENTGSEIAVLAERTDGDDRAGLVDSVEIVS